jgi:hypothetical protein
MIEIITGNIPGIDIRISIEANVLRNSLSTWKANDIIPWKKDTEVCFSALERQSLFFSRFT